jgi:hypothetical protein
MLIQSLFLALKPSSRSCHDTCFISTIALEIGRGPLIHGPYPSARRVRETSPRMVSHANIFEHDHTANTGIDTTARNNDRPLREWHVAHGAAQSFAIPVARMCIYERTLFCKGQPTTLIHSTFVPPIYSCSLRWTSGGGGISRLLFSHD